MLHAISLASCLHPNWLVPLLLMGQGVVLFLWRCLGNPVEVLSALVWYLSKIQHCLGDLGWFVLQTSWMQFLSVPVQPWVGCLQAALFPHFCLRVSFFFPWLYPRRYIIAPSIFHRGYSYLVLKLFKLRVPSLNLEHSSGRGNLTLKCGLMFKE